VGVRPSIAWREKEQARYETDDLAGGDRAVDEDLSGRLGPVFAKVADDGFVEEPAGRRKAEDPLR
jgi:hypothetical protein